MRKYVFVVCLAFAFAGNAFAITVTGVVTDEQKNPVAYCNVYVKETLSGTTTGMDGQYKLEVPDANNTLVFKYLGYKIQEHKLNADGKSVDLNVVLQPEQFELGAVTVGGNGEDPAYAIIRNAIAKRKFYLEEVNAYSCNVYVKGLQKLNKYPKKIMGSAVEFGGLVDSVTGIFYLSESVSKFSFQRPGKIKEEMISSRISGNSKSFSYNQASDMLFNFYDNMVMGQAIGERGYVSPIAQNALFYYRYKLLGSTVENNIIVYKIEVIPRRNADPVFRGVVYIQDGLWRLQNTDLYLTHDAGLEFLDTLRIRQVSLPVAGDIWMPVNNRFDFSFKVLGFAGGGNYISYFSDFVINLPFKKKTFTNEVLKINADANKRDSVYWDAIRPIPLTVEERTDYVKKEELAVLRESKSFNDSVDQRRNKFSLTGFIINGYLYRNSFRKTQFVIDPLTRILQYNTVEGWCLSPQVKWRKRWDDRRKLELSSNVRYGISNLHLNVNAGGKYLANPLKESLWTVKAGSVAEDLTGVEVITPFLNTLYTLTDERNFAKLYEKNFLKLAYSREWLNGFTADVQAEFAQRLPLYNTSFEHWINKTERSYTSNNPLLPVDDVPLFQKHNALITGVKLNYIIGKKYISRPDIKIATESKWPAFDFSWKQGISSVFDSKVSFTQFSAGLTHTLDLGIAGYLNYRSSYSWFANKQQLYFLDYFHFKGNQTLFSDFEAERFYDLDYYSHNTTQPVFTIHGEYRFNHFLFNKIPLLRKLKLQEIMSVHYQNTKGSPSYSEIAFGLEKFQLIRVDVFGAYTGKSKPVFGIRFGVMIF